MKMHYRLTQQQHQVRIPALFGTEVVSIILCRGMGLDYHAVYARSDDVMGAGRAAAIAEGWRCVQSRQGEVWFCPACVEHLLIGKGV